MHGGSSWCMKHEAQGECAWCMEISDNWYSSKIRLLDITQFSYVWLFNFNYCNDRFPIEVTNRKLDKYAILHPLLSQLGRIVLPPIITTVGIRATIHTTIVKLLQDHQISNSQIHILTESFSQIATRHLTHITLNKRRLAKKQAPVSLD